MATKDKIRGMFLGTFIGDTIGKPVETWDAQRIKDTYGRLTEIVAPTGHKWFNGHAAGTWTDDTQLTLAVAEGLIDFNAKGGEMNLEDAMTFQADRHIAAFRQTTSGWGKSTRESVRRLANGYHWSGAGEPGGSGNGVAMKIAPIGAYWAFFEEVKQPTNPTITLESLIPSQAAIELAVSLSIMTHQTSLAASSGLAQMSAIANCLTCDSSSFDLDYFIRLVVNASRRGREVFPETLTDDLTERLTTLHDHENYDFNRIISDFGGGSCYSYNSVPFTMMFFVKNHSTIESLYDVTNAGGDTDSNASMLGALLGALHGTSIFPSHLTDALDPDQKNVVLSVADQFYDTFSR